MNRDKDTRSINIPDLPVGELRAHPLARQIKLLGILHAEHSEQRGFGLEQQIAGPMGIVFRFEDRTHVAVLGQPIVDEEGQPVEALRNWKLECLDSRFALLSGADADVVLRMEKKQPAQP